MHQELTDVTLGASRSGAVAVVTSIRGAQPVASSTGEQMEEGAFGAPMENVAWLGVAVTS